MDHGTGEPTLTNAHWGHMHAIQETCEVCPPQPPSLPSDIGTCGVYLDLINDGSSYFVYMYNAVDVAGFQFGIFVDGVMQEVAFTADEAIGSAAASGLAVSGGTFGTVIGIDVTGEATIPATSYGLLTKLSPSVSAVSSNTCLSDLIFSTPQAEKIMAGSPCDTALEDTATSCLALPPAPSAPDSGVIPASPPPSPPQTGQTCFYEDTSLEIACSCQDNDNSFTPILPDQPEKTQCEAHALLCPGVPEVALACPVTCMKCPSPLPAFNGLGECDFFVEITSDGFSYEVYLATAVELSAFQFTIIVDGEPIAQDLVGEEYIGSAFAAGFDVNGGLGGVIVGLNLLNAEFIQANTYGLLTRLIPKAGPAPVQATPGSTLCLDGLIAVDAEANPYTGYSPCLPHECMPIVPEPLLISPPPPPSPPAP
eukprot:scaffold870_cov393-Prasinococcus_capsulatus_cf.AAC.1